jgi:hypothetical protein
MYHPRFMLLFLFLFTNKVNAQGKAWQNEFSTLFYNTENFFDCENDTTTSDDQYLANTYRSWTPKRLRTKTEHLAKVILAAGRWNPPVIVGLCEVENFEILEKLVRSEPLYKLHYQIIQKESPDPRGIDVALLYRPDLFKPFDYEAIPVKDAENKRFRTRDILRVSGVINNCDTLHFFVNHWPSRYGGVMETRKYRRLAAQTLLKAIGDIYKRYPEARIVCMGDFNDTPQDESLSKDLNSVPFDHPETVGELVNLSSAWGSDQIQTIKSKFRWETFDQFIVSDYFLKNSKCFIFTKAEVVKEAFLFEPDTKFGGVKTNRTYVGFKYHGGFSDHLPVALRFQLPVK